MWNRKLAWSKLGCIASISTDGRRVHGRNVMYDADNGQWRLSRECLVHQANEAQEGHRLCHLSWNHSGGELAVFDVMGRITVLQMVMAMNRLLVSRPSDHHHEDDLGGVVGAIWLQTDRTVSPHAQRPWCFLSTRR